MFSLAASVEGLGPELKGNLGTLDKKLKKVLLMTPNHTLAITIFTSG